MANVRINTNVPKWLYPIVKYGSYVIRYLICYFTIETIPIFESETAQKIFSALFGGVIYSVFWAICYPIVGCVSKRKHITNSFAKSGLYFVLYIPLSILAYIVLLSLTRHGVLPISYEVTFNFRDFIFNCLVWGAEKLQKLIQSLWDKVVVIINSIAQQ